MASNGNSSSEASAWAEKGFPPRKICVAEDNSTNRMMLLLILEKWGYQVEPCTNGLEAYESLSAPGGPRLALMDWMMPGLDGIQACKRLHNEFPLRNYYLILVSARTEDKDQVWALGSGADDFISKPFSPSILQARIDVGFRTLQMQETISNYATKMQQLADSRAAQLVHADRMSSLGLLSASVAHEINNPASFLAVNVQTLADLWPSVTASLSGMPTDAEKFRAAALVEEMPKILDEMLDGLSRIRQITSELRAFSRTGQNLVEDLDVADSLKKALRMCSIRLKGKVGIETALPDELSKVVADSTKLEQVFVNLIMNAADAMEDSPVKQISISANQSNSVIEFHFQDTGPGVPRDKMESLFQPFFTTKPAGKGTGLGLYISRGIIEEFKGSLFLCEPTGHGACFTVRLPARPEASP